MISGSFFISSNSIAQSDPPGGSVNYKPYIILLPKSGYDTTQSYNYYVLDVRVAGKKLVYYNWEGDKEDDIEKLSSFCEKEFAQQDTTSQMACVIRFKKAILFSDYKRIARMLNEREYLWDIDLRKNNIYVYHRKFYNQPTFLNTTLTAEVLKDTLPVAQFAFEKDRLYMVKEDYAHDPCCKYYNYYTLDQRYKNKKVAVCSLDKAYWTSLAECNAFIEKIVTRIKKEKYAIGAIGMGKDISLQEVFTIESALIHYNLRFDYDPRNSFFYFFVEIPKDIL
ncbi:hypothetical protein [Filimonas lacunae]|uniref:hypothetical protein n=1 Tax=Filimonas lacunae TaxID=477680 RepID=UPI00118608F3|nr:hypothetical protein [Filimonas lacunae]